MTVVNKIYTLTVIEKVNEAPGAVTIKFKQPALKKVKYLPGQYLTVVVTINGRKYRRPYSISSVFGIDTSINITVKAVPDGVVSNYLVNDIVVGQSIEIIEPMGNYIFPYPGQYNTLYLWSAGSGITPNYAILKHVLYQCPDIREVVLVYSNKNTTKTIFYKELQALSEQFRGRFIVKHIHTWPDELSKDAYYHKRIDADCIKDVIKHIDASSYAAHFICGPIEMKKIITDCLLVSGFLAADIYSEDFHHSINEEQLNDVIQSNVQLLYNGQIINVTVDRGKSILEACLDAGYDILYSCQSGSCTLCKAKLLSGNIKKVASHAPDKELEKDECLTCCSYPLSSSIYLEI